MINFIQSPNSHDSILSKVGFCNDSTLGLSDLGTLLQTESIDKDVCCPSWGASISDTPVVLVDSGCSSCLSDSGPGGSVPVAKVTKNLDKWSAMLLGDDNAAYILDGIENGFCIVDNICKPQSFLRKNYRSTLNENKNKVEKRILEEIDKGNYIKSSVRPNNVSSLGAVPKDGDDVRLIHDLSRPKGGINSLAWDTSVTYTSVDEVTRLIKPTSYLAKIDLKSAYRSIPISKECFDLTGLQWFFKGDKCATYLFDSKLPFGAAKSCRIFQCVTDSICRAMARQNFVVRSYIDDFVCVADDEISCLACYHALIELIESLGLEVNYNKVCLPQRVITFLGVVIDCNRRSLSLPDFKIQELKVLLSKLFNKKKVTKLELQKILRKLNWASRVIKGGRTFMRRLIDLSCKPRESFHYVRLNMAAKQDLSWWIECLSLFNGTCKFRCDVPLPNYCFSTDACLTGGGAFFGADWFHVNWLMDCPELHGRHINELELATVVIALLRWGPQLEGSHVRVRSDNMATVAALNNSTSRGASLMPWVRELFWLGVRYDITITSSFIPGVENLLADRLSRLDSLNAAADARVILADFSNREVMCKTHITYPTFLYLQSVWIRDSSYWPVKPINSNDRPWRRQQSQLIEVS
jgi:hypothetical protein